MLMLRAKKGEGGTRRLNAAHLRPRRARAAHRPPHPTLSSECSYKCTVVERALKQQFLEWGQSCVVMNYLVLLVFMVRSCVSLCPLLLCGLCILLSIIFILLAIAKDNFPLYFT